MKRTITILLLVATLGPGAALAQNWTVGVPVHTEIIDLPVNIAVTAYCDSMSGQEAEFHIPLPVVTGVSYYVHVDAAIPSTDVFELIHNGISQILGLGDSMLIVPVATANCIQFGAPCEIIKLNYAGAIPQLTPSEASLKFMAVGIPTVAGEHYPYGTCDAWYNQGIGCMFPHYVAVLDLLTSDTCFTTSPTVQAPTFVQENMPSLLSIFPNPARDEIKLMADPNLLGTTFQVLDHMGKTVYSGQISAEINPIPMDNWASGIYLLHCGEYGKRRIVVVKE